MNFLALLFVGLLGTGYAIQIDSRKSTDNAHAELAIIASLPASDSGRISTDHSYHPSTLVTHVKAYPPQQTHLGPGDHVINIPKGVKVFAGPLDFSSPRSTDSPADAVSTLPAIACILHTKNFASSSTNLYFKIGAIRHTDLRRRTMEENAIVDNASPVISNEDSTIQQETENTPDIHAFANTGNPRIPFVMPRPPLAHRSNEPSPNRPYSRSIMVSARQNPPVKNITIWPSLLVPVSKLHPDIEFGDWPRNLTWMVEGANEGGLEVAYDVPVNNASHCSIEFFLSGIPGPMNVEGANWTSSIYAYRYGAGSVSENDTWNERPQVDYGVLVANITVSIVLSKTHLIVFITDVFCRGILLVLL